MNFQQLEEKINEYINTNGERAITGAKLNEILHDIVETVKSDIMPVQVVLSETKNSCSFMWPYEDTDIEDVVFDGYNGFMFEPEFKFPLDGMNIQRGIHEAAVYNSGTWRGDITKLEKGQWYIIYYPTVVSGVNCTIYLRR